ncbi:RNA helicase [Bacillus tianshenii]|uniref:helicase-related protein n=1 Tax=Sutcliffiella tianshenii TaxID=1463404 RepID=UPI001CD53695|nr:helicase-related protein [Bacillus tianshenii]MCA1319449.1 RNA helicase [Bacillus tianshenii]
MNQLNILYPIAVDQTKFKIQEDILQFLETKEEMPTFQEYLEERGNYIQQIWINVWLNKVTNDVARKEKKAYLSERGYEVEGVDRKLINQLFRNEMREYQPFAALDWLKNMEKENSLAWEEQYRKARILFEKRIEEKREQAEREEVVTALELEAHKIVENSQQEYYLIVRNFVADKLDTDLHEAVKFEEVDTFRLEELLLEAGSFNPEDYSTVASFLTELTGAVHKTYHYGERHFEYETYYFKYEKRITDFLFGVIPEKILKEMDPALLNRYEDVVGERVNPSKIRKLLANALHLIIHSYMEEIQEEYVSDLLELVPIPYEKSVHQRIYEEDVKERVRRKAAELAEIERKKQEEERMLDDIFGREYIPSAGRDIRYILHVGETNTGKTYQALQRMQEAESGLYLAPLRLLALEVYDVLNAGGIPCTLKTGEEEKIEPGAKHISSTVEMFYEKDFYEVVVIDEAQMIADKDRGFSWYKAITKANAKEVHIIGSYNMQAMILQLLGDADVEVHHYKRDTPLQVESRMFTLSDAKKGDALVCFSRKKVLETASSLQQRGYSVSMIYGSMPPETRKKQMQDFINGKTSIIIATDAIGMGLNLPIRRIVFLQNEKFDGTRRRRLTSQEVKQIAGRAGRKGIYNIGKVAFTGDIPAMAQLLEKKDQEVHTFAIAPTSSVLERFQKYSRRLGTFFELWEKFESPEGTEKASLSEEQYLYETIKDTVIEARLSAGDLYGFLHLPFSTKEQVLVGQWQDTMFAIVNGTELPEPYMRKGSLEDGELSYKAVGLHLLFLYRLDRRTEATYWERIRESFSDEVHERLKTDVKTITKQCRNCGERLAHDFKYGVCDRCHFSKMRRKHKNLNNNRHK